MNLKDKYGPWALITGGATGLGKAFAKEIAGQGVNIIIVDIREEDSKKAAQLIEDRFKVSAKYIILNLAREDILDVIEVETKGLEIGLVINNAGIASLGPLITADKQKLNNILDVNCRATMLLSYHFVKQMAKRKKGGIVVVSSLAGTVGTSQFTAYSASKAFGINFGEALWEEMRPYNIDVKVLVLGSVNTPAYHWLNPDTKSLAIKMMEVEEVAKEGLSILGKNKPTHVVGSKNRLAFAFMKLFFSRKKAVEVTAQNVKKLYPKQNVVDDKTIDAFYKMMDK